MKGATAGSKKSEPDPASSTRHAGVKGFVWGAIVGGLIPTGLALLADAVGASPLSGRHSLLLFAAICMNAPAFLGLGILEAFGVSVGTLGRTESLLMYLFSNVVVYGLGGALGAMWLDFGRRMCRLERGLCQSCGYNLTGNTSGVCPECSQKIERDSG